MDELEVDTPDDATVVLRLRMRSAPEDVFAAFTDADRLRSWFWPERLEPAYEVTAVTGGVIRAVTPSGLGFTGRVRDLVLDRSVRLDWQWDGDTDVTDVLIETFPDGSGTLLRLTHGANPTLQAREHHRAGWTDCLSRLAQRDAAGRLSR